MLIVFPEPFMIPFSCNISIVGRLPMNFFNLLRTLSAFLASEPCREAVTLKETIKT